jgi:ketosteroid isomerase-like protein
VSLTASVAEKPATSQPSVAVVQQMCDAFGRKDIPAIFGLCRPDCEIYQSSRLPWGGRYEGHAGLGDFLTRLTGAIVSHVEVGRYIDDEEGHVVAVGHTRGRVVATGRAFDVPETHVWTVQDGAVRRFESYVDTAQMRAALDL